MFPFRLHSKMRGPLRRPSSVRPACEYLEDRTLPSTFTVLTLADSGPGSLRQAIAERMPETSAAITAAGFTLAASFGMLAIVPLRQFRELAFVMGVGVLLDALVVRSVLAPSLLTLLDRVGRRPGEPARREASNDGVPDRRAVGEPAADVERVGRGT